MATFKLERRYSYPTLRQKIFFLGSQGEAISGADVLARKAKDGGSLTDALKNTKADSSAAIVQKETTRAANRAANQANAAGVKEAAMKANLKGYNAGMQKGMQQGMQKGAASVGLKQGALNSWNRMGTMGKIGTGAALAGGAYLIGKGLFGGKKKEE